MDMPCPPTIVGNLHQPVPIEQSGYSKWYPNLPGLSTRLLTNSAQLQEIYNLRLEVWEQSGNTEFVNRQLFPNGWYDELDTTAFHWVTTNETGKIVAAARLNLFTSLDTYPYYPAVDHLAFPSAGSFAFFSRLVVHPTYRRMRLSDQLYQARKQFYLEREIHWSQVFINNPGVIRLFESEGYTNIGKAEVNYHTDSLPHSVNVFVKEHPVVKKERRLPEPEVAPLL